MADMAKGGPLKIASFNVRRLGPTKLSNKNVTSYLIKIISRYSIVMVLEVIDKAGRALRKFLRKLNSTRENKKHPYSVKMSNRIGRTFYKGQFLCLYREDQVSLIDTYQYEDNQKGDEDAFSREPFILHFSFKQTVVRDLALIFVHTKSTDTLKELGELYDVFQSVKRKWKTDNIILLGDFNADGANISKKNMKNIKICSDPNFHWLIGDDVDTTTTISNDHSYDRIVVYKDDLLNAVVPNSAKPFNFQKAYGLTEKMALKISDHYPVEVSLKEREEKSEMKKEVGSKMEKDENIKVKKGVRIEKQKEEAKAKLKTATMRRKKKPKTPEVKTGAKMNKKKVEKTEVKTVTSRKWERKKTAEVKRGAKRSPKAKAAMVEDISKGGPLKIASFNVRKLGPTKLSNEIVTDYLIKIISRYSIVMVLEVIDKAGRALRKFLRKLNSTRENQKRPYSVKLSARLGRSFYKEQFLCLYREDQVSLIDTYQYEDNQKGDEDAFSREPFILHFSFKQTVVRDLVLIPVHTKPTDSDKELDELYDVCQAVMRKWETDNLIILGDFNADGAYVSKRDMKKIRIRSDLNFHWLIGDDVDTTATISNDHTYDRIVAYKDDLLNAVVPNSAKPFNFQKAYGLTEKMALNISDHYPVEVTLRAKDEESEVTASKGEKETEEKTDGKSATKRKKEKEDTTDGIAGVKRKKKNEV